MTQILVRVQLPVGVSATSSPGQFAIFGAKGEVSVYRTIKRNQPEMPTFVEAVVAPAVALIEDVRSLCGD